MIRRRASDEELRNAAVKAGMITMRHDGARKAAKGITTLEEVLRATFDTE